MKIVISHVYSNHNKGDAALLSVLISDIKKVFNSADIKVLSLDKVDVNEKFDGVPVINSFMYFAREGGTNVLTRLVYASYLVLYTFTWAILYRFFKYDLKINSKVYQTIEAYRDADLIITVGGGYIRANAGFNGTFVLVFILHPILFSYLLGKITIGYSQSIGPFSNLFQEKLASFVVRKMDAVIVREKISEELLKKWGIAQNVFVSVDSGFQFNTINSKNIKLEMGIQKSDMLVGVTVRQWLSTKAQDKYEKDIAILLDYIIEKYGAKVIFIPQVTVVNHNDDDRVCSKRVYDKMRYTDNVILLRDNFDHNTIKSIYAGLDYMIGTRFHSVIFSLTSKVPSIAIQYEHKTRGIMRDLDLEEWVIDIDKTDSARLKNIFDDLVNKREKYVEKLSKNLDPYIKKAENTINIVKEIYDNKIK
jgi:colanic acid/amylovoran biosynthesis protein